MREQGENQNAAKVTVLQDMLIICSAFSFKKPNKMLSLAFEIIKKKEERKKVDK